MVVALFLEFFVGVIIADVAEMFFATNVFPTGFSAFFVAASLTSPAFSHP